MNDSQNADSGDSDIPDDADISPADQAGPSASAPLSAAEIAESKEYAARQLHCELLDMAIDLAYLGLFVALAATRLQYWIEQSPVGQWPRALQLVAMLWILLAGHYLVSFPLTWYSGYVLEHRFQLSRQSAGRWLWRYLLSNALTVAFSSLLIVGLYLLVWHAGSCWWLWAAAAMFVVSMFLSRLVPVLVLPLFYKVEPLDEPELETLLQPLVAQTTLQIEGLYRLRLSRETVKANAMLAGVGKTRRILLGDTLLDQFTPAEISVVLAHEIGHHVYRHIGKLMMLGLAQSLISFLACDVALRAWSNRGATPFDYSTVPLSSLPLMLLMITILSRLTPILQNYVSRGFERACDRYALNVTGNPEAYRSAFTKLARINKTDPDPHRWEVWLLHDHPPIAERLAMAGPANQPDG